jgi:hypothetical protein
MADWCRFIAIIASVGLILTSLAPAEETPDRTLRSPDGEVPSFYVRAVTGPLAGKSVCYVCRNGDRPVVVVLLRELSPDSTALLKELDRTVNKHRAEGLRCFAVLLTDTPQRDLGRLQTLAFDEKIDLPLTLAGDAAIQGSALAFPRDAALSVITYQDRQITKRFSYKSGACDAPARQSIVSASESLVTASPSAMD